MSIGLLLAISVSMGLFIIIGLGYLNIVLCKKFSLFKKFSNKKVIKILYGIYFVLSFLNNFNKGYNFGASIGFALSAIGFAHLFIFISAYFYSKVNGGKSSDHYYSAAFLSLIFWFLSLPFILK